MPCPKSHVGHGGCVIRNLFVGSNFGTVDSLRTPSHTTRARRAELILGNMCTGKTSVGKETSSSDRAEWGLEIYFRDEGQGSTPQSCRFPEPVTIFWVPR